MLRLWLALLAALALLWPGAAAAEERILHYHSDVSVGADGTLDVAETIRVRSEGIQIVRGIYRDFPTRYSNRAGARVRVGFEVVSARRDGADEPWKTEREGNGVRVYMGDADTRIPPGEHVYELRYRTTRQLGFFGDYDELYWNATGNGWIFPIDVAEARIRLPRPVPFGKRAVYTGPEGATDANGEVVAEAPGDISFRTTAPLGSREGLTVAVAWEKGVVAAPPPASAARAFLRDYAPLAAGALALAGLLAYYFHAWRRAGRDPRPGTVVPIFSPPDGLSAAAMRYITKMGADSRAFAAALVQLGVGGHIRLVEEEGGFFTRGKTTIERKEGPKPLTGPEADMMSCLFGGGDSILMDQKNHATFSSASNALEHGLKKLHEGRLFVRNRVWAYRGLGLMIVALALPAATLLLTAAEDHGRSDLIFAAAALGLPAAAFGLYRLSSGSGSAQSMGGRMLAILLAILGLLAGLVTIGNAMEGVEDIRGLVPLLVPLLALPVVLTAFSWMAAPTREGRAVLDRIAGFRHYLSVAEEDRLEALHPPDKTPELFERYLPYAIALKVENDWASRFTSVLAAAAASGQSRTMSWYSGHSDPWNDPGDFADQVGGSLASTISSSSAAPGSSSGSGGGGSSGGGGGGGGGGGW
ncbi:MAG TPA: DUF2207 domain-containing protein [Allosphingosinicella sp.]|jgi:uncharacterized membrane protein YgcG